MLIEIPKTVSTHTAIAGLRMIGRPVRRPHEIRAIRVVSEGGSLGPCIVINERGRFIDLSDETPFCLMYPLAEFMKCNLRLGRDGCSLKFVEQKRADVIPFPARQPTPPGAA